MGVSSKHHTLTTLHPQKSIPGISWIEVYVDVRASLDTRGYKKVFHLCQGLNPHPLVCNQTLY